ncbi:hypothetical protein BJY16_000194 [Actinoplanes octamycinicus]|uniref:DUF559 domain-containing protein n=1 Tax=Actinoplanes octamycinicus TaxID=135948 RepID=A0A7W7GR53_9ACTN|nr:DUF559 domain-containing protein [Actinoplanes octamycinicus]MBB4736735.1 hypothetical protein [Actinoplanes octamycinicus]
MPVTPRVPDALARAPFRGSAAVAAGLLTSTMLRSRVWQRLLPDVYLHRDCPLDHRTWCAAVASALPPGAAIGGPSAAHLWGADLLSDEPPVSVVTPRDGWINRHPRILAHHTVLAGEDVTVLHGIRVTTPERTVFDLGRRLGRTDALILLDGMLRQEAVDVVAVAELSRQRRRWPRTGRLREVLALGDGRAGSPMETRLRLLLHDAGLPAPHPQLEIHDGRGRWLARVDLGWPEARVVAEYEGDHHRERAQFRRDVGRYEALREAGWTVLRFTAGDVLRAPHQIVHRLATLLTRNPPATTADVRGL